MMVADLVKKNIRVAERSVFSRLWLWIQLQWHEHFYLIYKLQ